MLRFTVMENHILCRLLREMGWKEEVSDDENYAPLTEDELREFRDRQQVHF